MVLDAATRPATKIALPSGPMSAPIGSERSGAAPVNGGDDAVGAAEALASDVGAVGFEPHESQPEAMSARPRPRRVLTFTGPIGEGNQRAINFLKVVRGTRAARAALLTFPPCSETSARATEGESVLGSSGVPPIAAST